MRPVDFLKNECINLLSVLDQTLRYDYGLEGSRIFYEECGNRLKHISLSLDEIDQDNPNDIAELAENLENLSTLVCRIERSSLGEYSWPFVEEFKRISQSICTVTREFADYPAVKIAPNVHVIAEGGLNAYAIHSDPNKEISDHQIIIIEFPRTLKHYVLFHTILGHEMGHAIYGLPNIQTPLSEIFVNNFVKQSRIFQSESTVVQWLYAKAAPEDVRAQLNHLLTVEEIGENQFFLYWASYDQWLQEFLCDLIGLLMFGPSFLAALCHLLYTNDPNGTEVNQDHPPTSVRANILLMAAEELGYTKWQFDPEIQGAVDAFWADLNQKKDNRTWFTVISQRAIGQTIAELKKFLADFDKTLYVDPDPANINHLVKQILSGCPPVGYSYTQTGPDCRDVDFRDIIFAGWIASAQHDSQISFSDINRLCEHGIMQQVSIRMMLEKPEKKAA